MSSRGGDRHAVGRIRGRSVDWGPRIDGRAPCSTGQGRILHQTSTSVLRGATTGDTATWTGCLRLLGRTRRIDSGSRGESVSRLTASAVAGRFSALGRIFDDHYGNCSSYLKLSDNASARQAAFSGEPGNVCGDSINSVAVDSSGLVAWHALVQANPPGAGGTGLSCPSSTLCVGTSGNQILSSTTPTSTVADWTATPAPAVLGALACPTTSFCLATASGGVYTTGDPTGGPGAWTFTPLGGGATLGDPSCPTASFCPVVADVSPTVHEVLVSSDPAGGATAWTGGPVDSRQLLGLSCASASFCATTDTAGDVVSSTYPATPGSWHAVPAGAEGSISCPARTLCVADGTFGSGTVAVSTDPTAPAPTWTQVALVTAGPTASLGTVTCPSTTLCEVLGPQAIHTSTDPAAPGGWTSATVASVSAEGVAACAASALCVVGSTTPGTDLVSTDPVSPGSFAPRPLTEPPQCLALTRCVSEALYVHDDRGTRSSTPPPRAPATRSAI